MLQNERLKTFPKISYIRQIFFFHHLCSNCTRSFSQNSGARHIKGFKIRKEENNLYSLMI
jgi:hypothetical protein